LKIIAKTLEGLEYVLAAELTALGVADVEILKRAVRFDGNLQLLYKANLMLRTCLRLLVFVKEFGVKNENDLYNEVKKMAWEDYISVDDTFAIDSVVNSTKFRHANFIALKVKDAIADRFREKFGSRPNVDTRHPDLLINVHIREDIVTLSLDSSGWSLHMRGYRKANVEAPLNEVLAAGMILLSGWDKLSPLLDPMCGSATILCEAALIASNKPPQNPERNFAFKKWKNFDNALWNDVKSSVFEQEETKTMPKLMGFDKQQWVVEAALINIKSAGLEDFIQVEQMDFFYQEGTEHATLIFNPPYDERIKEIEIAEFYRFIGDKLKLSFQDCTAWILSGNVEAMKNVGLRPSRKISLLNGSIPSLYCRYDMYKGSKKLKWQNYQEN
jgi:putative N6-adenine-specific DNA methylase